MNHTQRTGPVFSRAQVLEARLNPVTLAWFVDGRGADVFPVGQFDVLGGQLEPRLDVSQLWRALSSAPLGRLQRWLWITGPNPTLGGATPLQHLTWRGADETLVRLVRSVVPQALAA